MNSESTVTVEPSCATTSRNGQPLFQTPKAKFSRGFCDTFKPAPDTMVQSLNSLNIYPATQSIKKNFKKPNGFTVNILYPRNCTQLIFS